MSAGPRNDPAFATLHVTLPSEYRKSRVDELVEEDSVRLRFRPRGERNEFSDVAGRPRREDRPAQNDADSGLDFRDDSLPVTFVVSAESVAEPHRDVSEN